MSLTYRSKKRNRVYQRKFDHDECRKLREQGETIASLTRRYNVSYTAIKRVLDPEFAADLQARSVRTIMSGECIDCGKKGISKAGRRNGRCKACAARASATTVRPDTLWCPACQSWKPDDQFPGNKTHIARRGRGQQCSSCGTLARRAYRNRNKVPCEGGCGRMVEGKGRPNSRSAQFLGHKTREKINPDRPYYCRKCWHQLKGDTMAVDSRFYVLVEQEPDVWKIVARVGASSRDDAIQQAFPNGVVPEERVCVMSGTAFKPGKLVAVQRYALQQEDQ